MRQYPLLVWLSLSVTVLVGCSKDPAGQGTQDSNAAQQPATEGVALAAQTVAITVGDDGFVPNNVELTRGTKVTLRFTRTTEKTCATDVVFPELGLNRPLPLNLPVDIEVPTNQSRTLTFQCGMGMYKSHVVVR